MDVPTDGLMGADPSAAVRFELAYEELRGLVETLERGGLGLDEAVDLLERGMVLAGTCETLIDRAELRVRRLVGEHSMPLDGTDTTGL